MPRPIFARHRIRGIAFTYIVVHQIDDSFQKHVNLILEYLEEAFDYLRITVSCANAVKPVVFHSTHARNLTNEKKIVHSSRTIEDATCT